MQAQRRQLDDLCSRAFSCGEWLLGRGVLDVLGEKHAACTAACSQAEDALAKADAQVIAIRGEIASVQARVEMLADSASSLRARHAAQLAERGEEDAIEDLQARPRARAGSLS